MRGNAGLAATATTAPEFTFHDVELAGVRLVADRSGALWWPAERTLIVADLHLEKASAHAARGIMLPPYDSRDTLARLSAVIDRWQPRSVISLGDSLHDHGAHDRMEPETRATLARLQHRRTWLWITGNHDPAIAPDLGGDVASSVTLAGVVLRHAPEPSEVAAEIAGHLHPAARIALKGSSLRSRCFARDQKRIVLPAFGAFTGGLNVLHEAFAPLLSMQTLHVLLLGSTGIYPVSTSALQPD
ncbi:MAG: ligase-associated DNA damage response endonuclease PdeM [Hyphomicrobiaceae bacterium]